MFGDKLLDDLALEERLHDMGSFFQEEVEAGLGCEVSVLDEVADGDRCTAGSTGFAVDVGFSALEKVLMDEGYSVFDIGEGRGIEVDGG